MLRSLWRRGGPRPVKDVAQQGTAPGLTRVAADKRTVVRVNVVYEPKGPPSKYDSVHRNEMVAEFKNRLGEVDATADIDSTSIR